MPPCCDPELPGNPGHCILLVTGQQLHGIAVLLQGGNDGRRIGADGVVEAELDVAAILGKPKLRAIMRDAFIG